MMWRDSSNFRGQESGLGTHLHGKIVDGRRNQTMTSSTYRRTIISWNERRQREDISALFWTNVQRIVRRNTLPVVEPDRATIVLGVRKDNYGRRKPQERGGAILQPHGDIWYRTLSCAACDFQPRRQFCRDLGSDNSVSSEWVPSGITARVPADVTKVLGSKEDVSSGSIRRWNIQWIPDPFQGKVGASDASTLCGRGLPTR